VFNHAYACMGRGRAQRARPCWRVIGYEVPPADELLMCTCSSFVCQTRVLVRDDDDGGDDDDDDGLVVVVMVVVMMLMMVVVAQIINVKEMRRRLSEAELDRLPLPELSRRSDILQDFHLRTVTLCASLSVCLSHWYLSLSVRVSVCLCLWQVCICPYVSK